VRCITCPARGASCRGRREKFQRRIPGCGEGFETDEKRKADTLTGVETNKRGKNSVIYSHMGGKKDELEGNRTFAR